MILYILWCHMLLTSSLTRTHTNAKRATKDQNQPPLQNSMTWFFLSPFFSLPKDLSQPLMATTPTPPSALRRSALLPSEPPLLRGLRTFGWRPGGAALPLHAAGGQGGGQRWGGSGGEGTGMLGKLVCVCVSFFLEGKGEGDGIGIYWDVLGMAIYLFCSMCGFVGLLFWCRKEIYKMITNHDDFCETWSNVVHSGSDFGMMCMSWEKMVHSDSWTGG